MKKDTGSLAQKQLDDAATHLRAALEILDKHRRFDASCHVDLALYLLTGQGVAPHESS